MALRIVIDVLLVVGAFFALAGTIGVVKMPDTYCRMQASTCVTTLGSLLYAIFIMGHPATAIKIAVIAALVITVNPVGAHAIAKGAYRAGIRPEKKMEIDDFRRDFGDE